MLSKYLQQLLFDPIFFWLNADMSANDLKQPFTI